jgi:hypothetical protein
VEKNGSVTLPAPRHETYVDINDKPILWLRCHKLKPENESLKSFPTQLNDMISIMVSYNNALSVQLQWMLKVMEEEEIRDDSDER